MARFIAAARRFAQAEEGATMVEYGLMLALIALICIGAVAAIGTNASSFFSSVGTSLGAAS